VPVAVLKSILAGLSAPKSIIGNKKVIDSHFHGNKPENRAIKSHFDGN
jgi:hypothetical protein